jgi:hypothetical protein
MTRSMGFVPDSKTVQNIVDTIALRCEFNPEISLRKYIDDLIQRPNGTGRNRIERLKRPPEPGFFQLMAKKFGIAAQAPREVDSAAHPAPREKCQTCLGRGKLPGGDYCQCQMGKDMRIADVGRAKSPKTKGVFA